MDKIYFSVSFGGTATFSVLRKVKSVNTIVSSYYAMEALMQWEGFCCFRKYCHKMKHLSLPFELSQCSWEGPSFSSVLPPLLQFPGRNKEQRKEWSDTSYFKWVGNLRDHQLFTATQKSLLWNLDSCQSCINFPEKKTENQKQLKPKTKVQCVLLS